MPWWIRGVVRALQPLGRSPAACAEFMCAPAFKTDEELKRGQEGAATASGVVILDQNAQPGRRTPAHGPTAREAIWATTEQVLRRAGLSGFEK